MYGPQRDRHQIHDPIPRQTITYQTAFVDDAAGCRSAKAVYGRDAPMLAVLRNAETRPEKRGRAFADELLSPDRRSAGLAVNLPATTPSRPAPRFSSGRRFFERLFRGPV